MLVTNVAISVLSAIVLYISRGSLCTDNLWGRSDPFNLTDLAVFANSVDPDEPARDKPSHQDLHFLQLVSRCQCCHVTDESICKEIYMNDTYLAVTGEMGLMGFVPNVDPDQIAHSNEMGAKQSFPVMQIPKDRVFVVTGANSGIGYETAKWIAMMGGTVIMACRSEDRAMKAMCDMDKDFKEEKAKCVNTLADVEKLSLEFMQLDLASFQSTNDFVEAYTTSGRQLHVLICCAGIYTSTETTENGFETMLQVNYLSHFLMIGKLLPLMKSCGDDVRLVLVSSRAHWFCRYDITQMNYTGEPDKIPIFDYYGRSKLYQLMQMYCLHRRLRDSNVTVTSVHPGLVDTEIGREYSGWMLYQALRRLTWLLGILTTRLEGATTVINCAVSPDLKGVSGVCYKDCKPSSTAGTARDEDKQEAVWHQTMDYLKDQFTEEEVCCLEGGDPDTVS